jgi:plasmid maintenance system antidote protein VapI
MGRDAPGPITAALREAIIACRRPLKDIARQTGVERASLSRFVRGERSLRLDVADKLAEFFGIKLQITRDQKTTGS